MAVNTPYLSQGAGIPTSWTDTFTTGDKQVLAGHLPALLEAEYPVADSQDLADLTVVGFNASGEIVAAVYDATYASLGVRPIGVLVHAVDVATPTTQPGTPVYRAGCFNVDALVWPASFDTDAKKFAAFEGAPSPTQIIVRRPKQATV